MEQEGTNPMFKNLFHLEDRNYSVMRTAKMLFPFLFAGIVGVGAGLLSVGLIKGIQLSEHLFLGEGKSFLEKGIGPLAIILIPCIGGLLVGLLVNILAPETRGHGIPEVMKAIAIKGGKMRFMTIPVKMLASALSIGSGASVGREGPAVQVGSAFGSVIAQIFRLNTAQTKNLVACGAAAGIAAVFNAPLAGMMFSLEVIMRDFGAKSLSTVVVAALAGSIVGRALIGNTPAFLAPSYSLNSPFEIFLYLLLGIASAFVALLFIVTLDKTEDWVQHRKIPGWLKPALGGLLVGCMALITPHILGAGLGPIELALTGSLELKMLIALIFLKIAATSISLGSGSSGGTFAPTLFVGAVLGGAFGKLFFNNCPFPVAPPGAYALVGMASVFAGATHAPVTAILLIFELTGDYKLILPIMAAVVASTAITQFLSQESIDTVNLKRLGIDIQLLQETKFLSAVRVGDAMSKNFDFVPQSMSSKELINRLKTNSETVLFVQNDQKECLGVITAETIRDMLFEKEVTLLIADDLMSPLQELATTEDSLSEAAGTMTQLNLKILGVVDVGNRHKFVGVLRPEDFHHAFTHITLKQAELLTRLEKESAQAGGIKQYALTLRRGSLLIEKKLKDLNIPQGVMFTSIERQKEALIPSGDTILKLKDKVWVGVAKPSETVFKDWVKLNKLKI